jgi:hypothetical protein
MSGGVETVTLTSGVEAAKPLVATVVLVLRGWMGSPFPGPLLAYDVAMMARDPGYKPFGKNGAAIREAGFIDDMSGRLHRSIADIVSCAFKGDGLEMVLVNPVQVTP